MSIRGPVQLLGLALAAMLGACTQHTATTTKRSPPLIVGPQAFDLQVAPQRQASIPHARRVAAVPRKHTPFAAKPVTVKQAALTDGAVGIASFYKYEAKTASGEQFNPAELTAAHRTLPFGTRLRVTNLVTGQSVTVRVNDRGPYIAGRVIDVSKSAAEQLGMINRGITQVKLEVEK